MEIERAPVRDRLTPHPSTFEMSEKAAPGLAVADDGRDYHVIEAFPPTLEVVSLLTELGRRKWRQGIPARIVLAHQSVGSRPVRGEISTIGNVKRSRCDAIEDRIADLAVVVPCAIGDTIKARVRGVNLRGELLWKRVVVTRANIAGDTMPEQPLVIELKKLQFAKAAQDTPLPLVDKSTTYDATRLAQHCLDERAVQLISAIQDAELSACCIEPVGWRFPSPRTEPDRAIAELVDANEFAPCWQYDGQRIGWEHKCSAAAGAHPSSAPR